MKTVLIRFDEELLRRLASDDEVQRSGLSAFLQRVATEYLETKRGRAIQRAYEVAYADPVGVEAEAGPWDQEGMWPAG